MSPCFGRACPAKLIPRDWSIRLRFGAGNGNLFWATDAPQEKETFSPWSSKSTKKPKSRMIQRDRAPDPSSLGIPQLFGLPQRADLNLPQGASLSESIKIDSNSKSAGKGSVKRKEKLTLRVAATIVDVLPNGVLNISGSQELRVNFELRELSVSGFVRPEDISRQNEITYDKIASARVSYGGRGQITDVQQPRYGQQILDAVLPF